MLPFILPDRPAVTRIRQRDKLELRPMGASHLRFGGGKIVEKWTVFDEVGVFAQADRA